LGTRFLAGTTSLFRLGEQVCPTGTEGTNERDAPRKGGKGDPKHGFPKLTLRTGEGFPGRSISVKERKFLGERKRRGLDVAPEDADERKCQLYRHRRWKKKKKRYLSLHPKKRRLKEDSPGKRKGLRLRCQRPRRDIIDGKKRAGKKRYEPVIKERFCISGGGSRPLS